MPNWVECELKISGSIEKIAHFKKRAKGYHPKWKEFNGIYSKKILEILCFHKFVPVPQEVLDIGYSDSGYTWCCNNWGTKWGACYTEVTYNMSNYLGYLFETAWNPPLEWLNRVGKMYPELTFDLFYREPGIGFAGSYKIENGELMENETWDETYDDETDKYIKVNLESLEPIKEWD